MGSVFSLLAFLLVALAATATSAHESRPLYVEIEEKAPKTFAVRWKIPPSALGVTSPAVRMPENCTASAPPAGGPYVKRQLFRCKGDLSGATVRVEFPGYNPSISTMFRLERVSGERHVQIKGPDDPAWQVPQKEKSGSVARQYLVLGVEHILKGYDHLLFVACLIFIAGGWRRILITITGFTISHSITLALAALDLVRIPVPPVEAAIALSIVFLATEIAREKRDTLTWRYPIAVSASFGLLHGFGFANVLGEIGMPQTELAAALFFFNAGVELGQVIFVAFVLVLAIAVASICRQQRSFITDGTIPIKFVRPVAYLVGPLAAYWMIERMFGFMA